LAGQRLRGFVFVARLVSPGTITARSLRRHRLGAVDLAALLDERLDFSAMPARA
jgi:hypothetical protein